VIIQVGFKVMWPIKTTLRMETMHFMLTQQNPRVNVRQPG